MGNPGVGTIPRPGMLGLLGVPYDESSSFLRGPAMAPGRIREALHSGSANLCAEDGRDFGSEERFVDLGDLALGGGMSALAQIETAVLERLADGGGLLSLGGDHAVTYPLVRAHCRKLGRLDLLHLDAHPDLYDSFEGNRLSNACPFARIMEEGLVGRLVQVGIRTMNPHQRAQAGRFGVEVVEMRSWEPGWRAAFERPVYISLDLDVLDPAHAPGVSHREPGGFTTREVIRIIQQLEGRVVGADIVEYNPLRDPQGVTAMAAAKLLKEMAARIFRDGLGEKQP